MAKKVTEKMKQELFLDYISGMTYKELANKQGITVAAVNRLVSEGKWADRKTKARKASIDKIQMVYVDAGVEIVNRFVHNNMRAYGEVENMLNNPECITDKNGKPSVYKLREVVETMHTVENQIKSYMNILDTKDAYELQMKQKQLEAKLAMAGIQDGDDDSNVQDTFSDVLAASIKKAREIQKKEDYVNSDLI